MTGKTKALISLLTTVLLFSLVVIISRYMVTDTIPQMYLLWLRMLVAGLAFLPFFIRSEVYKKPRFRKLVLISLLSSVNLVFFMWGIKYTTASASQLIYAAQPVLTIAVTALFQKTEYSGTTVLGVVLGFVGMLSVLYFSAAEKGVTINGSLGGNLSMLTAMLGWFTYILLSKKYSAYFSPAEIGSVSILTSLGVSSVLAILQYSVSAEPLILSRGVILSALYLGIFGSFLTYLLMQYAIKHLSPLTVNLTSYVQPILTAVLAMIFLGEMLTVSFVAGSFLVFTGVFFAATMEFIVKKR